MNLHRSAGFALVEVLVALVIAAFGLQLAFEMFATHTRMLDDGIHERRAAALAESLLARVGPEIPLQPGITNGRFDHEYRWQITVAPFAREGSDKHPIVVPYDVALQVSWRGRLHEQSLRLETLKLAPPPASNQ